ncbi:phosphoinositide 3-kinase adapter protein 1-like [Clavelina lepadiformis]|uniref:phosphoinositide 3-kinase adapter protein 1-like n=1 Tax=Clavelina lepadiformis TaxID=159417 RepID=UPI0040433CC4
MSEGKRLTINRLESLATDVMESCITIVAVHDGAEVGSAWKDFIENMFTIDLPESYRDLGIDVVTQSMLDLEEDVSDITSHPWKLFLFSDAMLDALRDSQSTLSRSNLLKVDPDRTIILILGDENDAVFSEHVRRSLCVFPGFASFHLIQATSTGKIFQDIMVVVSPLFVVFHPHILSSEDTEQHVTLIANKAYPTGEGLQYIVEFHDGNQVKQTEASLFNPYTLLLQNPGHQSGTVEVLLYACSRNSDDEELIRSQLGETMKVCFQSDMDRVSTILEKSVDPFHFLCQALNVKPGPESTSKTVDKALTDSFHKHVPDNNLAMVFGTNQGMEQEGCDYKRKEYAPTLLHFAAMHGLCDLTALLLRCPGSVRAFATANCDGDYPTNLAEKFNHWELKKYMTSYMEVSAMVDYEMGDSQQTSQFMAQMVTGQYYSLENCESGRSVDDPQQPAYLPMKPITQPASAYDTPFVIPIPVLEAPNYDSVLANLIEDPEEVYSTMTSPGFLKSDQFKDNNNQDYPTPPLPRKSFTEEAPPPLPERSPENSVRRGGADRVTYGSLEIPLQFSHVSPAQRELIMLQQKVKKNELTTNQAVLRFKEWERKHKEQAASFQFQQECLQRIRNSLMRSQELKRKSGKPTTLEITAPITAGSSTYDRVLRKTNVSDPSEVQYGVAQKPMRLNDGFARGSSTLSSLSSQNSTLSRSEKFDNNPKDAPQNQQPFVSRPPPIPPREDAPRSTLHYQPLVSHRVCYQ